MVNRNIVFSIIIILIALGTFYNVGNLEMDSSIFPQVTAVILVILNLLHIFKHLRQDNKKALFSDVNFSGLITLAIGIVIYVIAIKLIGFLVASLIFLSAFMWFLNENRKKQPMKAFVQCILIASLITFGFYGIFQHLFLIPLPQGLWF